MAGLTFAINKRRRAEGGFPGAMRILAELENGPPQQRVGFDVEGRQPVREGALILDGEGNEVGKITSGGFSPSLQRPIAMGYVATPSRRARHCAEARAARQIVRRPRRPNALRPPPLSSQGSFSMSLLFHQGARMGPGRGRHRDRRHFRPRAGSARRHRFRRSARGRPPASARARKRRWSNRSRRRRTSMRRFPAR